MHHIPGFGFGAVCYVPLIHVYSYWGLHAVNSALCPIFWGRQCLRLSSLSIHYSWCTLRALILGFAGKTLEHHNDSQSWPSSWPWYTYEHWTITTNTPDQPTQHQGTSACKIGCSKARSSISYQSTDRYVQIVAGQPSNQGLKHYFVVDRRAWPYNTLVIALMMRAHAFTKNASTLRTYTST